MCEEGSMAKFPGVRVGNMPLVGTKKTVNIPCRYSGGEGGEVGPLINLLKAWLGIMLGQDMEICPNPIERQPLKKIVCFGFNL